MKSPHNLFEPKGIGTLGQLVMCKQYRIFCTSTTILKRMHFCLFMITVLTWKHQHAVLHIDCPSCSIHIFTERCSSHGRCLSVIWHFALCVAERHGPGWKCDASWTFYSRPPSLPYPSSHQQTASSTGVLLYWQDCIIAKITLHTPCVLHFGIPCWIRNMFCQWVFMFSIYCIDVYMNVYNVILPKLW